MENSIIWKKSVNQAFYGFLAYTLLSGIIDYFVDGAAGIIVAIIAFAGYVFYFLGIKGMKTSSADSNMGLGTAKLYNGVLLGLIGAIVDIIPLLGWVAAIINVVAFFIMMSGFNNLRKVATNPLAAKGANMLWLTMIISIVSAVFGIIPLLGNLMQFILSIVIFVLAFLGWKNFSNSEL